MKKLVLMGLFALATAALSLGSCVRYYPVPAPPPRVVYRTPPPPPRYEPRPRYNPPPRYGHHKHGKKHKPDKWDKRGRRGDD